MMRSHLHGPNSRANGMRSGLGYLKKGPWTQEKKLKNNCPEKILKIQIKTNK